MFLTHIFDVHVDTVLVDVEILFCGENVIYHYENCVQLFLHLYNYFVPSVRSLLIQCGLTENLLYGP